MGGYNRFFGIVPILDMIAGIWNFETWRISNDQWKVASYVEMFGSLFMLVAWVSVWNRKSNSTFFEHIS